MDTEQGQVTSKEKVMYTERDEIRRKPEMNETRDGAPIYFWVS